jgi:hypothetical protein
MTIREEIRRETRARRFEHLLASLRGANPMRQRARSLLPCLLGLLSLLLSPTASLAGVSAAPDITADLSGVIVTDDQVAIDDQAGGIVLENLGDLPVSVEVDAYHSLGGGAVLFSLDTAATLGGVPARAEDVVRFDGADYSIEFDGSAEGIPPGTNVDAVSRAANGDLILSFDTTVALGGATFADEDLVRFDGVGFAVALDASEVGFDPALDLDGVNDLGGGVYAFSFDGSGFHGGGGFDFADEDVLSYDPAGPTLTLLVDSSAAHAGWVPADLGALPEPGVVSGLLAGSALLAVLRQRRGCRPDPGGVHFGA